MNNDTKQDLIEKYLSNTLTIAEKAQFEQLQAEDADFVAEIDFFKNLFVSVEVFGDKEFAQELKALDEQMEQEVAKEKSGISVAAKDLWEDFIQQIDYTLDQLAAFFAPNPNYSMLLQQTNRGGGFTVSAPSNGFECLDFVLRFKIENNNNPLTLSIEDNSQQLLHRTTIESGIASFEVNFSEINIHQPGRYYWKLTDGKETLIREFFLRKDLMHS